MRGKEPQRTERILAHPFALARPRPIDAFQSREGFFMFRVNGSSFFGRWYRVLVIILNMAFGTLSGLQPLLTPGSAGAFAQTACVLSLQLGMSALCFTFMPDADRIISRFAATQFLSEGLSTTALFMASVGSTAASPTLEASNATATSSALEPAPTGWSFALQESGFYLSLFAMAVPMLQLLEARAITPTIGIVKAHGVANKMALLAAVYMLAASLPRKIVGIVNAIAGHDDFDAGAAAGSATADAGDDAVEAEGDGGGGENGEEEVAGAPGLSGGQVSDAAQRASKLMARAIAAKEAAGKAMAKPAPVVEEPEEADEGTPVTALAGNISKLRAAAHVGGVFGQGHRGLEEDPEAEGVVDFLDHHD